MQVLINDVITFNNNLMLIMQIKNDELICVSNVQNKLKNIF